MQRHHAVRSMRLWVLAFFLLALGVAAASPALQPRSMETICSGAGTTLLIVQVGDDTASAPPHALGMECPLCLAVDAAGGAASALPLFTMAPAGAPRHRAQTAAPHAALLHPPARAPPDFFN